MAAAHLKIYCNGVHIRTFGGNRRQVREMKALYDNMTIDEFYQKHHTVIDEPKSIHTIKTRYYVKNNGVNRHRVTYVRHPKGLIVSLL